MNLRLAFYRKLFSFSGRKLNDLHGGLTHNKAGLPNGTKLKDGTITTDVRLDRLVQFDERSRKYPVRTIVPKTPRSYTWACKTHLDQGVEGACVGFAWTHEINAAPKVNTLNEEYARRIYRDAQKIDEWPGENYEGTSVLAGAKTVQALGYMKEYRWAFSLEDALFSIGHIGPGVAGLNWYEGMTQADSNGYIHPTGRILGGHAILVRGVNFKKKYILLHNSWGSDWSVGGTCKLSFEDFGRLLSESGEYCVPVGRKKVQ